MKITSVLLYLLLLYAVLDKSNKLSVTSGMLIACGALLLNCYCGKNAVSTDNVFSALNGF